MGLFVNRHGLSLGIKKNIIEYDLEMDGFVRGFRFFIPAAVLVE